MTRSDRIRSARPARTHPRGIGILCLGLCLGPGLPTVATAGTVAATVLTGLPVNMTTPLRVEQNGFETLRFDARFRSEPLTPPIYWAVRLSFESSSSVWSLELNHHKLYLRNPPPTIERFSVSHGFNLLTLQRAWPRRHFDLRAGAGLVVAHAESTIRGRRLAENRGLFSAGYYLTGPVALGSITRSFGIGSQVSFELEARGTVARAVVPIDGGDARFVHAAAHLMVGISGTLFR